MKRRFATHLFTLLSAVSLLLSVAVCVWWVRNLHSRGPLFYSKLPAGTNHLFYCAAGEIEYLRVKWVPVTAGFVIEFPIHLCIPCWLAAAGLALPAAVRGTMLLHSLRVHVRRRRRQSRGDCPACGYDLRGSPQGERCPECGTPAATAAGQPAV